MFDVRALPRVGPVAQWLEQGIHIQEGCLRRFADLRAIGDSRCLGNRPALGIVDHLRRTFARFKLSAHFLDLRCLLFNRGGESVHSKF
jgi:hypothetical protein